MSDDAASGQLGSFCREIAVPLRSNPSLTVGGSDVLLETTGLRISAGTVRQRSYSREPSFATETT